MGKPWAKYEVGFINHTKFKALNANALGLWIEGKNFADANFTDGILPTHEVEHWKYFSKKAVVMLTTSCGQKASDPALRYAPLWEIVEGVGWKMHDYLDHNECREDALTRIVEAQAKADARKQEQADRMRRWRDAKAAQAATVTPNVTRCNGSVTQPVTDISRDEPRDCHSYAAKCDALNQNTDHSIQKELSLEQRASHAIVEDAIATRGARALERYQVLYAKHRHGAHYRPRPNLDWLDACDLCRHWDDARLEKLAVLVLTTDDPWIAKTDRSFKIFAMKASAMDDRLAQWEAEQGRKVGR